MSCSCNDSLEPLTNAAFVLTKNDLYKLRTNRVIIQHYHGTNLEKGRITLIASNEQGKIDRKSKLGQQAIAVGDVVPLVLSKHELEEIGNGKVITFTIEKSPPVKVTILSAATYHLVVVKNNEAKEKADAFLDKDHSAHIRQFLKYARWEIIEAYQKEKDNL